MCTELGGVEWMADWRAPARLGQRGKSEYNLVLLHPDDDSVESWSAEGSADKMRADFADFEPRCAPAAVSALTHLTRALAC